MKVLTGLDIISRRMPSFLLGKRLGILCHAASISSGFVPVTDIFSKNSKCIIGAVFGPQHGLFGQTQDNMIEWEGDQTSSIPIYSLYGQHRKPTASMLKGIEAFVVDLQDVGARLYTYIWTVKLCMEACSEAGIPVYVLDRPNPVAAMQADGPVLKKKYFTFVGGAEIPLCHRMTIGEMAIWIRTFHATTCELYVVAMEGWNRSLMFRDTGLPWVLPSPNMPSQETAVVYPGTVLFEAMNISEGRGTVIPFELFGAPFINATAVLKELKTMNPPGCAFRNHDFIPTFNKFYGEYCHGIQIHVTDYRTYRPVETMVYILRAIKKTSPDGTLSFNLPPYEYEYKLMPFDILSGDNRMREVIENDLPLKDEKDRWKEETSEFLKIFKELSLYSEE